MMGNRINFINIIIMSVFTFSSSEKMRQARTEYFSKTLCTLSMQLFFTFGSVLLVNGNDLVKQYFVEHFYELSGVGFIGSFLIMWWMISSVYPTSFHLGLFTVFQTITICTISPFFENIVLIGVIGLTFTITTVLAIIAYFSKRIDSHTEYMMLSGLAALLIGGVMNLFFNSPIIHIIELFISTVLFMAYIVLDVQRTIDMYIVLDNAPNIHILACLNIYLDILNLFIRLLQIYSLYAGKKNKNDGR